MCSSPTLAAVVTIAAVLLVAAAAVLIVGPQRVAGWFRLHPDAWRGIRSRMARTVAQVSAVLALLPAHQGVFERFWDLSLGGRHIAGAVIPGGAAAFSFLTGLIGANRGDPRNTYLAGGADASNPLPTPTAAQAQAEVAAGGTSGPVVPGVIPDDLASELGA